MNTILRQRAKVFLSFVILFNFYAICSNAQSQELPHKPLNAPKSYLFDTLAYAKADSIALATRLLPTSTPKQLASQLTQSFKNDGSEDTLKVRAIYRWVAENIGYDIFSAKTGRIKDNSALGVLRNKIAVCQGYSQLMLEMCQNAGLSCSLVTGFGKGMSYTFGQKINRVDGHAWNVVKINGNWRLVDVTWGAGAITAAGKFKKRLSNAYFLGNPYDFILNHFPKDPKWQLLSKSISLTEFEQSAFALYTIPFELKSPRQGFLKVDSNYTFSVFAPDAEAAILIVDGNASPMSKDTENQCFTLAHTLPDRSKKYNIQIGMRNRQDIADQYELVVTYSVK